MVRLPFPGTPHSPSIQICQASLPRHTWTSWSASPPNGADLGDNTRGEMSRGMLLMFKATLELLRWQNRQQKGIKPRFRFGSVLLKNRGFGTDFDNRNNTRFYFRKPIFLFQACIFKPEVLLFFVNYIGSGVWGGGLPKPQTPHARYYAPHALLCYHLG